MKENFYDRYYEGALEVLNKKKDKRLVKRFLLKFIKKEHKILDSGGGPRFECLFFYNKGYNIDGRDISKKIITKAKKIGADPKYFVHSFLEKPPNEKYDLIYSSDVIEHINNYDTFLKNLRNSLVIEGILLLITPNANNIQNRIQFLVGRSKFIEQKPHIRFFSSHWIQNIVKRNGFKIHQVFGGTKTVPFFGLSKSNIYKSLAGSIFMVAIKNGSNS
jgi:2-polyprenyl-3-methyl-5-hydroxy-6-metoxy-1,4-benzoquinol methylase